MGGRVKRECPRTSATYVAFPAPGADFPVSAAPFTDNALQSLSKRKKSGPGSLRTRSSDLVRCGRYDFTAATGAGADVGTIGFAVAPPLSTPSILQAPSKITPFSIIIEGASMLPRIFAG